MLDNLPHDKCMCGGGGKGGVRGGGRTGAGDAHSDTVLFTLPE